MKEKGQTMTVNANFGIRQYCYSTGISVIDHASSSYDDKLHALTNIEGGKTFSRPWGLWHCFWKTEESLIQET